MAARPHSGCPPASLAGSGAGWVGGVPPSPHQRGLRPLWTLPPDGKPSRGSDNDVQRLSRCAGGVSTPLPRKRESTQRMPRNGSLPSTWWRVNDNRAFQCQDQDRQIRARNRFDKVDSRVRGNGSLSAQRVTSRQFNSRRWLGRMVRGPHHGRAGGAQR